MSYSQELKQLINNLVTECMQCHAEIRVRDVGYKEKGPVLCPRCRCSPKTARIAGVSCPHPPL